MGISNPLIHTLQASMTVLITGSNKGIGFHIARLFAKNNHPDPIIITSRNIDAGNEALSKLQTEFPNSKFHFHQLDLVDEKSRQALFDWVKKEFGTIKLLVNNAGFAFKAAATESNAEQSRITIEINYFATLAFTHLFQPIVTERIVHQASGVSAFFFKGASDEIKQWVQTYPNEDDITSKAYEFIGRAQFDRLKPKFTDRSYHASKFFLRAAGHAHAKMWPQLKVYTCCPGWCQSDMAGWEKPPRTAEQGAYIAWWLATSNDKSVMENSGNFYWNDGELMNWTGEFSFKP